MKMKRIVALIFDLGEVLVHNHPEWAARRFSKLNGISVENNMKIMENHIDYMKGEVTTSEFARRWISSLKLNISEQEFHRIYTDIFSLNEPLFRFLKEIRERVALVMLSNTEEVTVNFLKEKYPELFSIFHGHCVFSYELHMVKPQKQTFFAALNSAGAKPEDAVFIDDKLKYVRAAKELGINALQYRGVKSLKADLQHLGLTCSISERQDG